MRELEPIAALAGHFDWVQPSGFVPTLGGVRNVVPVSDCASPRLPQRARGRTRERKHPPFEPGQPLGVFTVVRQLDRNSTSNERVLVRCAAGHTLTAYAHNIRAWPASKRCKSCDVAAQRDSAIAGMSIGGGPALASRAR